MSDAVSPHESPRPGMSLPSPSQRLLRHYLLSWVLGTVALVWCSLVGVAYYTGWHEAEEVTDGLLVTAAEMLLRQPQLAAMSSGVLGPRSVQASSYSPELHVVVWERGQLLWDSHGMAGLLPAQLRPGHQRFDSGTAQAAQHWHLYVEQIGPWAGEGRRVAVFLDVHRRKALERDIAEHIARPALVLFPLVAALLVWAIARGLAPLRRLSRQIAELDADAGQSLPPGQRFQELRAIADAINGLVMRLKAQVQRERGFASDVAHELRTPLTAIVWQARAAREAARPDERRSSLQQVEQDALRAGRILTQLLALARAQGLDPAAMTPVDLNELARQVLAEHAQQAHDSAHELALNAPPGPVWVHGHATMLELALRNLVDNALRHTPAGTHVDVLLQCLPDGATVLSVMDDGAQAATPSDARPGLGIGLTLVQRIADWHHVPFDRGNGTPPYATRFTLTWPAPAQGATALRQT